MLEIIGDVVVCFFINKAGIYLQFSVSYVHYEPAALDEKFILFFF